MENAQLEKLLGDEHCCCPKLLYPERWSNPVLEGLPLR